MGQKRSKNYAEVIYGWPLSGNITQHNLHSMDSLVTRITSEASQYVNNVDSWVVGFRNYYVSNLGHSQGLAKEENIDQIHSALAQFLYSPNGGKYKNCPKNCIKIPYNIAFLS